MVRARPPEAKSGRDRNHPRAPRYLRAHGKHEAGGRHRQGTSGADARRHTTRADQRVARDGSNHAGTSTSLDAWISARGPKLTYTRYSASVFGVQAKSQSARVTSA